MDLVIANMIYVGELIRRAGYIFRRCLREMDSHPMECPLYIGIHIVKHGAKIAR